MKRTLTKTAMVMASALGLAACGGGEDTAGIDSLRTSSQTALPVTVVSQNSGTLAGSLNTSATFDGTTDIVTAGSTTRGLDAASDLTTGLDYVGAVDGVNSEKFVLIATETGDMPTGTVTYTGAAFIVLPVAENGPQDGIYTGQMAMDMTADFGGTTNITFDTLTDGQLTTTANPTGGAYTATGDEQIAFDNLTVSGNTLASAGGTTLTVEGFGNGSATPSTSGATLDVTGAFAGPQAGEVAGVASASGSSIGGLSIVFAGEQ